MKLALDGISVGTGLGALALLLGAFARSRETMWLGGVVIAFGFLMRLVSQAGR